MRVRVVTPAPRGSRAGNRITAERWAKILRGLGHHASVGQDLNGPCDLLVALHARKSAAAVMCYRAARPNGALVVALTGTDVYGDLRGKATAALRMATRIVALQPEALARIPAPLRRKTRIIHQSMAAPSRRVRPRRDRFEVCVLGHLRPVKDPFRTALAARLLPETSRISVLQIGKALSGAMAKRARAEEARNRRYRWLGELPRARALQVMARCRLLVASSRAEGGANVLSEALVARVGVLASRIPGATGVLGADHPGLFEVGATDELARLLQRAEDEPAFYRTLLAHGRSRARLVRPATERRAWEKLLAELR